VKIAIMVREETTRKCTGKGCLRSFFAKTESFARYHGQDIELVGFFHNGGDLDHKLEQLKTAGVEVVHISTCTRGKDPHYSKLVEKIAKDFDVVGYTHGPAEGKSTKTLNISKIIR
jgi:predicted metal-binding protein